MDTNYLKIENLDNKNKQNIHLMPCEIYFNGKVNVSTYFEPCIQKDKDDHLNVSFRGKPLNGKQLQINSNYLGGCLKKNQFTDYTSYILNETFDQFTYWNFDEKPNSTDNINQAMKWLDLSNVLHCKVSAQDLQD